MLNRRSSDTSGHVNWPTHLENDGQGGMFVRLVVEDENFMVCCGGYNLVVRDECFVGTDRLASSNSDITKDNFELALLVEEEQIFPHVEDEYKHYSTNYICCLTIASTGVSYYDDEKERNWICTYNDLTEDGKALYLLLNDLYPKGTVTLQTWLDT